MDGFVIYKEHFPFCDNLTIFAEFMRQIFENTY